jgi:poly-gamma-glutamate synthesis protein (capsule biosynthesis protein)
VVLSDRKLKKEKKEFNFIGPTAYTQILTDGGIECVTVANNHTHDYGEEGYADTKQALEEAGICWFGTDAPAVWRSDDGLMIGFLGVNYSLTGNRAKRYAAQAERLRDLGCAAVITVMHAGTEYSYRPPDNYQAQIVDRAVKAGSCLVIGHHPHVLQGLVIKEGVPIVYSLGNCSFGGTTFAKDSDALTVRAELRFEDGELQETALTFYPICITSDRRHNNYSPCLLTGDDAERVLRKMQETTGTDPGERNPDGSATTRVEK